jgi:hypothetical protein
MRRAGTPRFVHRADGQRGAALIGALLLLLIVTVLGLALNSISTSDVSMVSNTQDSQEALAVAESGLAHARALLVWPNVIPGGTLSVFDTYMQTGDAKACTGDELNGSFPKGTKVPKDYPKGSELIPESGRNYGTGSYKVSICDDNADEAKATPPDVNPNVDKDGTIVVRSIGTARNGAVAAVEGYFGYGVGLPAISVNGYLKIEDHIRLIDAKNGGVYASGTLELEGDPCADSSFAATGKISKPEKSRRGPDCKEKGRIQMSSPLTTFPDLAILKYIQRQDVPGPPAPPQNAYTYFLKDDGWVYKTDGVSKWNAKKDEWKVAGKDFWKYDKPVWKMKKDNVMEGVYYSNANIKIEDAPNSKTLRLSFITDGYVDIDTDHLHMTPYMKLGVCALCGNMNIPALGIAVLAGTDLRISKKGSYSGVFYARHQIEINDDFTMTGQVISLNAKDDDGLAANSKNLVKWDGKEKKLHVKGNAQITYDGTGFPPNDGNAPHFLTWRECHGADAANPCS